MNLLKIFICYLMFSLNLIIIFSCEDEIGKNKNSFPTLNGKMLPEFECTNFDNKEVLIKHIKGQIIVLNTWSPSCGPCVAEIPGLNKLVEKYKENTSIRFIALLNYNSVKVEDFFSEQEFKYEQLIRSQSSKKYFYGAVPRNIVCDQDGLVIYDKVGGYKNKYKEIEIVIESAINGSKLYFLD